MDQLAELTKKIDALTNLLNPSPVISVKKITHEQRVQKFQRMIQLSTLKSK